MASYSLHSLDFNTSYSIPPPDMEVNIQSLNAKPSNTSKIHITKSHSPVCRPPPRRTTGDKSHLRLPKAALTGIPAVTEFHWSMSHCGFTPSIPISWTPCSEYEWLCRPEVERKGFKWWGRMENSLLVPGFSCWVVCLVWNHHLYGCGLITCCSWILEKSTWYSLAQSWFHIIYEPNSFWRD